MANNKIAIYSLLHDAYYGDGIFEAGEGLHKHPRESKLNYQRRQTMAYYLNYTGPIVDASVTPIYANEIKRDYKDTDKFNMFLEDVDMVGTSLQNFLSRYATLAKLYGVIYIVVDNSTAEGITDEDSLSNRALPFVSAVIPSNVKEWQFGQFGKLESFSYSSKYYVEGKWEDCTRTWTKDSWEIKDTNNKVISKGEHNLKCVPVVQWFGRNTKNTDMLPTSEFFSIAQTNYHIYHLCSLLSQIIDNQTYNILTVPASGREGDLTVGTNSVLEYPPDSSHVPAFIAPDSSPAKVIMDQIDRLIAEMYRMSGINSVIGVESSKSGVAKQWDFERTNQKLADFAVQCELAEQHIIKLYELWANETVDYTCEYPRDFKINDVKDALANAQAAIDLSVASKTFKLEIAKKVLEAYMANIDADVYDAIIRELEQASDIIEQGKAGVLDGLEGDE